MTDKPDRNREMTRKDKWLVAALVFGAIVVVAAVLYFLFAPRFG